MGGGAFGVEAASQFYFNKSVRQVNLAEAALLGGLFKAPTNYAPHINLPASRARANEVLTNMVEAGFLTEGQVHGARLNPAQVVDRTDFYSPDWFLDWAFEEVQRVMKDKGQFVLTVRTTVDISLQKAAERAVVSTLQQHGRAKRASQAAMVAMEMDGAVRALVGGKDYGQSQFNRAVHARRQPGSSFKPYVYYTALESGYTPETRVVDGFVSCNGWSPKNYSGGFRGAMPLKHAMMRSLNTVAVKLSLDRRVTRKKILENTRKLGIRGPRASCSMALGDTGIPPLAHTAGYAAFANGGLAVRPYAVEEIHNSRGELLYTHEKSGTKPKRVFALEKVEQLNSMLALVVTSGTGRRAQLDFTAAAGKTGTSSGFKDAWFMGYTGQYVAGVWFGNDNFTPTNRVTGGNLPAMTWKEFMVFAHASRNIPQIPGVPIHPAQVAEMERIAALKRANPTLGNLGYSGPKMPAQTREVLKSLQEMLGQAATEPEESTPKDRRATRQEAGRTGRL